MSNVRCGVCVGWRGPPDLPGGYSTVCLLCEGLQALSHRLQPQHSTETPSAHNTMTSKQTV
eukprot:scaffold182293_cov17-Prasinocladus_malaysianus.AAC.1